MNKRGLGPAATAGCAAETPAARVTREFQRFETQVTHYYILHVTYFLRIALDLRRDFLYPTQYKQPASHPTPSDPHPPGHTTATPSTPIFLPDQRETQIRTKHLRASRNARCCVAHRRWATPPPVAQPLVCSSGFGKGHDLAARDLEGFCRGCRHLTRHGTWWPLPVESQVKR